MVKLSTLSLSLILASFTLARKSHREDQDHSTSIHSHQSNHTLHQDDEHTLNKRAGCPKDNIVSIYYPAWSEIQTVAQIPFSKANFAFYVAFNTVKGVGIALPAGQSEADVYAFTAAAKAAGTKSALTIGAWGGSTHFSSLVSQNMRTTFALNILSYLKKYNFDAVDLDWEFVGQQGIGNNEVSGSDAQNLILFARELRLHLGANYIIHMSVQAFGWTGPDGNPISSTGSLSSYVNYITVMAYDDFQNAWSPSTGPNAALANSDPSSTNYIAYWTSVFPACRILLGVPGYSHIFKTASSTLSSSQCGSGSSRTLAFQALAPSSEQPFDPTTVYSQIIKNGWLSADGLKGQGGYTRYWDACTSTPFLFNPSTRLFIAYEDVRSTGLKALFARNKGLAGINFYDSQGLVDATYQAARNGLAGNAN